MEREIRRTDKCRRNLLRVIRGEAAPASEGSAFRAGVRFLNPSPATEKSLDEFLDLLRRQGVE